MAEDQMNQANEDNIIYFTKLNWVIFFWPIATLCIFIAVYFNVPQLQEFSVFFILIALLWIIMTCITYLCSSITLKKKRVILRTGIIVRQTVDIPLNKVETIDIRQSIVGTIFRYGTLIITGTGGTRHFINYIDKPLTCRRYIEQLMNEPH